MTDKLFDSQTLQALSVRLADRASEIHQVTLRGLADDLHLAARVAETLAEMHAELAAIANSTLDSATRGQIHAILAKMGAS
jgi:conjugal transfer/entry exclusion protein